MAMIHVNRAGTSLGVFAEEDVREGLRTGRFAGSDLGWREGMAQWQPLSQFTEFASDLTARAPPPTRAPIGTSPAPRTGLPWDERQQRGLFSAFVETLQMVLSRPSEAFTAMKREGGLGEPLIYAVIGGSAGLVIYFIYNFAFQSLGMMASQNNPLTHLVGTGIAGIFLIICAPILVVIGIFINAAILHVCLMIVGGAKQSFETTFRVVCFEAGSVYPLMIVSLCGGLIAGILGILGGWMRVGRRYGD